MSTVQREWYDRYMMPNYAPAAMIPVRGSGSRMWDQEDREYIDFGGGIAVNALGHAHPDLVAALTEQAGRLWHTSNVLATEPALELARRLVELTFADKVFFSNSGAEANEAALKLARRYAFDHHNKGKDRILAFDNAFHGRTLFTVTAGGQANYREGFGPLPGAIEHLPFNDIGALNETFDKDVCAVIVEPVQGEGGVIAADKAFLQTIRRVGTLYAYQSYGVTPDILTTAKGLGGGFPVAATLSTGAVAESLKVGTHGSTWGGNPMGCAVASAVLDIVSTDTVLDGVNERRQQIEGALRALGEKYGVFGEIRGLGLLMGCVLNEPWEGKARDLMHAAQDEGLFVLVAGASVLRIAPSLIIPDEDIAEGLKRLDRAIARFCTADKT